MGNEIFRIRKIHVQSLIDVLQDLWDKGVDFVDIYGTQGEQEDQVRISFPKDYMHEDFKNNFETLMGNDNLKLDTGKFSEEDLNDLI